ncbi:unnamed protein product [Pedinophyceae sp. YPF-701]|nr:unnamed protein product [Pedinophyceae sp. YPF-701]
MAGEDYMAAFRAARAARGGSGPSEPKRAPGAARLPREAPLPAHGSTSMPGHRDVPSAAPATAAGKRRATEALPEGFFDDRAADKRARGLNARKAQDDALRAFRREIEQVEQGTAVDAAAPLSEDAADARRDGDGAAPVDVAATEPGVSADREAAEEVERLQQIVGLGKLEDRVEDWRAARARRRREHGPDGGERGHGSDRPPDAESASDTGSDSGLDELLDWRARRLRG